MKLSQSQVQWIVREKARGEMTNSEIGRLVGVSAVWVRKLYARYRHQKPSRISYPARLGRPAGSLPGRREHSAVLTSRYAAENGAVRLVDYIQESTGLHIPHNTIHRILSDERLADRQTRKSG